MPLGADMLATKISTDFDLAKLAFELAQFVHGFIDGHLVVPNMRGRRGEATVGVATSPRRKVQTACNTVLAPDGRIVCAEKTCSSRFLDGRLHRISLASFGAAC